MAGRIDFTKRLESKRYVIKINGIEDFEGVLSELRTSWFYRTEIKGTITYTGSPHITINQFRLFDAESGREVANRTLPYEIRLLNGDKLTLTFLTTVKDATGGISIDT